MASSGVLRRVALVRTDVSEELSALEPHGVTSQKTSFFVVTAVKTSNLTYTYLTVSFCNKDGIYK
jgi:hypothetical protein